jgi:hypothetical protein
VSLPHLNSLWAAFDNTERRLDSRERHVVGNYRLSEALECERAYLFGWDVPVSATLTRWLSRI